MKEEIARLGAFAQTGSAMALTNDTVSTAGAGAHGLESGGASSIAVSGGSVTTRGDNAFGLFSTDAGSLITTSNGLAVSTAGQSVYGVAVMTGAGVRLADSSVVTTGDSAHAIVATDAGSTVTLSGDVPDGPRFIELPLGDRPANPVPVFVSRLPELSRASDGQPVGSQPEDDAPELPVPSGVNGRIAVPGQIDHFIFAAKKGERFSFEVVARRQQSACSQGDNGRPQHLHSPKVVLVAQRAFGEHGQAHHFGPSDRHQARGAGRDRQVRDQVRHRVCGCGLDQPVLHPHLIRA